jgi:hypothetical protein
MKYTANTMISVHAGALVKLSKEQAARTVGLVEPVDEPKGWHRVVVPFQFKAGEQFESDMEFGKGFEGVTMDPHDAKLLEESKARAKAEREARRADAAADHQAADEHADHHAGSKGKKASKG